MQKIKNWFSKSAGPALAKLGNQRHLASIRDGFVIFMPILIAGSLAIIMTQVIFTPDGGKGSISGLFVAFDNFKPTGGYRTFLEVMTMMFKYLQAASIDLMTVYFTFSMGYALAKSRKSETPVIAGMVALAAFLASTDTIRGGVSMLGGSGLIGGIITTILFTELFCWLSKSQKLQIQMPAGVPPAVGRAFSMLIPGTITLMAAGAMSVLLVTLPFYFMHASIVVQSNPWTSVEYVGSFDVKAGQQQITLVSSIYAGLVQPFVDFASSHKEAELGLAIFYVMLVSIFWFFGLHGLSILMPAFGPVWFTLYNDNVSGGGNHVFVTGTFEAYIFLGGWGATIALVIATLIFGKKGSSQREVSKFALPAGVFNINEPVTFGYPLILNFVLAIPLFIVSPILVIMTYLFIGPMGLVPKTIAMIPWTAPTGIGGLIASGSPWGFVLAILNLAIATAIYTPFVLLQKRMDNKAEAKAAKATTAKAKA